MTVTASHTEEIRVAVQGQTQLAVRRLGPNQWVLLEDFTYRGSREQFTVRRGFITDFASNLRLLQAVLPRIGRTDGDAVLHDQHCRELAAGQCAISSCDVDGLFRQGVRRSGETRTIAWLAWTGVRWGALKNPDRRAGWWRDSPAVLAISAAVLLALFTALLGVGQAFAWLQSTLAGLAVIRWTGATLAAVVVVGAAVHGAGRLARRLRT